MRSFISRIRTRTWVILSCAVGALVAVAIVMWFVFLAPAGAPTTDAGRTQTVTASLTTLEQSVSSTGTLTPSVQESLSFGTTGTVTAVNVGEGDTVAAGDVLATVDDLAVTEALLSARADLASAEARVAESEASSSGTTADLASIAAERASVDVAAEAVATAEAALDDVNLTAPVAGMVTSVDVAVGDVISSSSSAAAGSTSGASAAASGTGEGSSASATASETSSSAQITLVSTDAWTTTVSLSASDLENVEVGDEAALTVDGVDDTVSGTVTAIGLLPSTDSGAALFPVTITTTGSVDGLYDGLSATVSIVYERRTDVLAVPSAAVTTTDGVSTATRLDEDGDEVAVEVTVGETAGGYTEILEGLAEGDDVIMAIAMPGAGGADSGTDSNTDSGTDDQGQFPGGGELPEGFEPPADFGGQNNG
jgi:macrolide-specific efflux system membrane fusion protein